MLKASSQASLSNGPEKVIDAPESQFGWRPWNIYPGVTNHLADNFIQVNFGKKATLTRVDIAGSYYEGKFVKSFLVSYSQDSAFWKHVLHFGKPKVRSTRSFCDPEGKYTALSGNAEEKL